MRLICIGDSNTFGYDPGSFWGDPYPSGVRWTERLGCETVNLGQNGLEIPATERAAEVWAERVRSCLPADAVLVMLGTNDLLMRPEDGATAACGRMERFLHVLQSHLDGTRVVLIAPPRLRPGSWVAEPGLPAESEALAERYAALAGRLGVGFADAGDWGCALCSDGVHLTPEGHAAFAKGLRAALEGEEKGQERLS